MSASFDCWLGEVSDVVPKILDAVAKATNVSTAELLGDSKRLHISHARHVAVYLLREIVKLGWADTAATVGRGNHTTAMNSHAAVVKRMAAYEPFNRFIVNLRASIEGEDAATQALLVVQSNSGEDAERVEMRAGDLH